MKDPGRLDSSTGLLNTQTMQQELIAQVSRSRRYLNPLSVVMIRLQDMEEIAGGVAGIQKQRLIRGIAKMLKEKLRWVDVVGCWDKDAFMLILPETSQDAAGKLVRKLQTYIHRMLAEEERTGSNSVVIDIGLAEWTKGDDLNSLLARVERDLRGDRDDRAQDAP
jgi:diguanylate cyclase (GGDEF)-like protein